jgi:hypothetical protein
MSEYNVQYKRNSKSSDTELLPGASILAIHTPTLEYSALSNGEGRFSMLNMKVGGPYKVMITFIGFRTQELNDVFLELGKPFNLDIFLQDESQQLNVSRYYWF